MEIEKLQRAIQEQEPQIWEIENNEGFYDSDIIPSYRAFPPRHKDELQHSVVEPLSKIDDEEIKLKILLGIIEYHHINISEDKSNIINNNDSGSIGYANKPLFLVKEKDAYKYFDSILGIYSSVDNAIECICNRVRPYMSFTHHDNETVVEERMEEHKNNMNGLLSDLNWEKSFDNWDIKDYNIHSDDWNFTYTIIKMELDENHV